MNDITLAADHHLRINQQRDLLELEFNGHAVLSIQLSDAGPVVSIEAAALRMKAQGKMEIEADSLHLRTHGDLVQDVGGHHIQKVAGNQQVDIRDDLLIQAQAVRTHALTGSMDFKANDDLSLSGLRVLHNVPSEQERLAMVAKAETFGQLMNCPAFDPKAPRRLDFGSPLAREDWENHGTE